MEARVVQFMKSLNEKHSIPLDELETLWKSLNRDSCVYKFTKGSNKDSLCGKKTVSETEYCKLHSHHKDKVKTVKKIVPVVKASPSKYLTQHPTLDYMWHHETKLLFENQIAVGYLKNGKYAPLDEKRIELCNELNFDYAITNSYALSMDEKVYKLHQKNTEITIKDDGVKTVEKYDTIKEASERFDILVELRKQEGYRRMK